MAKWIALLAPRGAAPALAAPHLRLAAEPSDAILAAQSGRAPRPARRAGLVCVWPGDAEEEAVCGAALAPCSQAVHRVAEVVHWNELDAPGQGAVVLVYGVHRRSDLSRADFAAHYRERHAPLARLHHPGIARYVQNYVAGDDGGPDAIAELWFASERDARERFYRDAESRRVIAADVARFAEVGAGFALAARPQR